MYRKILGVDADLPVQWHAIRCKLRCEVDRASSKNAHLLRKQSVKLSALEPHPISSGSANSESPKPIASANHVSMTTPGTGLEDRWIEYELSSAHAQRLMLLGEMTACFAHELNQPLCAALAEADAALNLVEFDSVSVEVLEAMRRVAGQVQRASEILSRIRKVSGHKKTTRQTVSLSDCVREAMTLVQSQATLCDVRIEFDDPPDLPQVTIDPVPIEQVVINLIRNGIEAMVDTPTSVRSLNIRVSRRAGEILLSFEDHGVGISEGVKDRVFEKFFTTKPNDPGLGLSISRQIVESHGGRIWFEPNAERGVTFYFTVPMDKEDASHECKDDRSHSR